MGCASSTPEKVISTALPHGGGAHHDAEREKAPPGYAAPMDSLPQELLMRVCTYAAPLEQSVVAPLEPIRCYMAWVASLRRVNRHWRNMLDDPKSLIWYFTAKNLGLDPPLQLFSGGTYRDVCQLLLEAERQKWQVTEEAARAPRFRYACGMMRSPRPLDTHPNPERPAVKLSIELVERVAANANALESFLNSIDFSILLKGSGKNKDWHQSSLNRYKMFLYLKLANPSVWLVPTADIEFCWLAHIFRTRAYWKDMADLGIKPDHRLCLTYGEAATFSQAVEATKTLWEKTFGPGFPYLPPGTDTSWNVWTKVEGFHQSKACRKDPRSFFPAMGPQTRNTPISIILPAIHLQAAEIKADLKWFPELKQAFREMNLSTYDVLRGHDGDKMLLFSQQILPSYERFLNLCNQQSDANFSPPYVIDLIWHAHQMEPHCYKADCLDLFGREFWHEPWPHGLGVSSPQTREFECAWKQAYGTPVGDDWKFYMGKPEPLWMYDDLRFQEDPGATDPT